MFNWKPPKMALTHKETGEIARTVCNCGIEETDYGWLLTTEAAGKKTCYVPVIIKNKENYHWVEAK